MLKQTVDYIDFDENSCRETLYFNLTKSELTEHLYLKEQLEAIQTKLTNYREDETRNTEDIQQILDLVKTFMRLSYGIRSEDGKRFIKTTQIWEEFTQTASYDAFLFSLFENPENAISFMMGIMPKDLREQAMEQARENELVQKMVQKQEDDKQAYIQKTEAPSESVVNLFDTKKPESNMPDAVRKWMEENPQG